MVKDKPYLKRADRVLKVVSGKILELGCGVGTYAKEARKQDLDWTAIDVSPWCKRHEATPIIKQDAMTYLQSQPNDSFDYVVSFALMECFDDVEIQKLKIEMDRVGRNQIHLTYKNPNPRYYNTSVKSRIPEAKNLVG